MTCTPGGGESQATEVSIQCVSLPGTLPGCQATAGLCTQLPSSNQVAVPCLHLESWTVSSRRDSDLLPCFPRKLLPTDLTPASGSMHPRRLQCVHCVGTDLALLTVPLVGQGAQKGAHALEGRKPGCLAGLAARGWAGIK